jgi:hypothetical protein
MESLGIGQLNEKSLHAALKAWYAQPEDQVEAQVDGYIIDVKQGDLLIEIQTANFSSIKKKMMALTQNHQVRLVYPIPLDKWLVKLAKDGGEAATRRKSPKRGRVEDVCWELVSFPGLLGKATFSLEVLLTREEEVRRYDGKRRWRRGGWVVEERRLLEVVERHLFERAEDLRALLPPGMDEPFTTKDLAEAMDGGRTLAQKMAYCLHQAGVIECIGRQGRANLYQAVSAA